MCTKKTYFCTSSLPLFLTTQHIGFLEHIGDRAGVRWNLACITTHQTAHYSAMVSPVCLTLLDPGIQHLSDFIQSVLHQGYTSHFLSVKTDLRSIVPGKTNTESQPRENRILHHKARKSNFDPCAPPSKSNALESWPI